MIRRSTLAASAFFTGAGTMHFVRPDFFESIVPDWFPAKKLANLGSGAVEIVCGLGLLHPRTRRLSALGLIGLLVGVFPANVDMALNDVELKPGDDGAMVRSVGTAAGSGKVVNWVRLPLQLPLVWWMWREANGAAAGGGRRATSMQGISSV
jgi:uncharacterized membrane protein